MRLGSFQDAIDQTPPHDQACEQQLIGCLMLEAKLCDEVALEVNSDDFHNQAHGILYRHVVALWDGKRAVDMPLLVASLKEAGELEQIGGAAKIAEVLQSVSVSAHYKHYAERVKRMAVLRRLILAAKETLRQAYAHSAKPEEVIAAADEMLQKAIGGQAGLRAVNCRQAIEQAVARLSARQNRNLAIPTGLADVDRIHGGLFPNELAILAARPGVGKSALALQVALHSARRDRPVLFISLEMDAAELMTRAMCSASGVDLSCARLGTFTDEERNGLASAAVKLEYAALEIASPQGPMTVADVRRLARQMHRRRGLLLLVLDYLQLLTPTDEKVSRQEQVASQSRALKGLARELEVPVLCLAQLNRQVEQGSKDRRPKLSNLRESGAIEQDADVVMFLHREYEYSHNEEDREKALLIVAKNRNGVTRDHELVWHGETTSFGTPSPQRYTEFDDFS